MGRREAGEGQGADRHDRLGGEHDGTPVAAVRDHAAPEREQDRGEGAGQADEAEGQGRAGEQVDVPVQGHRLHLGPGLGDELREPDAAKLAVAQRVVGARAQGRRSYDTLRDRMPRKKPGPYDTLWRLALALPGVEEGTSYGTPAFKVAGKLMARLKEDGESLVIMIAFEERARLMKADPATFYITNHYLNYPSMLVRLPKVRATMLRDLLEKAWRRVAPLHMVEAFDRKR